MATNKRPYYETLSIPCSSSSLAQIMLQEQYTCKDFEGIRYRRGLINRAENSNPFAIEPINGKIFVAAFHKTPGFRYTSSILDKDIIDAQKWIDHWEQRAKSLHDVRQYTEGERKGCTIPPRPIQNTLILKYSPGLVSHMDTFTVLGSHCIHQLTANEHYLLALFALQNLQYCNILAVNSRLCSLANNDTSTPFDYYEGDTERVFIIQLKLQWGFSEHSMLEEILQKVTKPAMHTASAYVESNYWFMFRNKLYDTKTVSTFDSFLEKPFCTYDMDFQRKYLIQNYFDIKQIQDKQYEIIENDPKRMKMPTYISSTNSEYTPLDRPKIPIPLPFKFTHRRLSNMVIDYLKSEIDGTYEFGEITNC